jgi:hypothetical protein
MSGSATIHPELENDPLTGRTYPELVGYVPSVNGFEKRDGKGSYASTVESPTQLSPRATRPPAVSR